MLETPGRFDWVVCWLLASSLGMVLLEGGVIGLLVWSLGTAVLEGFW